MANGPSGNSSAFGRPGSSPTWTVSSKDGIGTAYSTSSRVWFTLAQGILTEVYYPTIDRPQIRDAQFLVSDGETFFHEEKRDLSSTVVRLEAQTLGYHVTSSDPQGRYRLEKEIISDPHTSCVLLRARLASTPAWSNKLRLYFLLAPHLEVGGGNNSAMRMKVSGRNVLLAWKNSTWLAVSCDRGFARASCGFVGFSDGWQDLNNNFKMDWEFERAQDGNIAMMGEIDLTRGNQFTLGLAFGDSRHAAVTVLNQSLAIPFERHRARFIEQWQRISGTLRPLDRLGGDGGHLYRSSRTLLLSHEDKTFAGALIASASIPWGNAKGDDDLGGYHLVWVRDMVNSATALLASGDKVTPLRALVYLASSQQADGGFPQNFWIDGTPYWKGIQLDEVALPIILAWRLWKSGALDQFDPYPMVKAGVRYLIESGPVTQQERWEEASGYSPSTLAANIAALICAADFIRDRGELTAAQFVEDHADYLESHVERWTVTTAGTLVPGIPRHYIRILPVDINDRAPLEDPNSGTLILANQPPPGPYSFPAKEIVDAGFLELVRYGVRDAGTPLMEDSLLVIDAVLRVETPFGPVWRRYNHDGYGPDANGMPYQGSGVGRAWPLLTGERAHYELAAGGEVRPLITAMENFASEGGMLPEQVWDSPDLPAAHMYLGKPAGSAMPLMWAHAEYIKLLRSVSEGEVFDRVPIVAARYHRQLGRKDLEVWKLTRQVRAMPAGSVLRVVAMGHFRLRWSLGAAGSGQGPTMEETDSTPSGLGIEFVDIPTRAGQEGKLLFSFLDSSASLPGDVMQEVQIKRAIHS
ncbi:MAG TPA: glycoside hydrolase family 15 protein [Candidatus Angelobacter sp.]|nr:glycoside hydrolase family 15 protein [Candidatus Angelobacter sp.]